MVHRSSRIFLHRQIRRRERPLFANQNVEIVIGGVNASMTLSAEGGPEDDEVLRDACVDDIHGAHGAPSVAENPFGRVDVESNLVGWVRLRQVFDNVLHHRRSIIRVRRRSDGRLCQLVQALGIEDIPSVLFEFESQEL